MKRRLIRVLAALWLFLPGYLPGAEGGATGIVKGTIKLEGRPTSDVVVSVEGLSQEQFKPQISKLRARKAVLDQRDMQFIPRVLAVLTGTTVDFLNSDKTFHNVFSTSEAKSFDLGLYSLGRSRSVTFEKPGVVKILCHVHPHMEAFIVVKEHPYFSVTDKQGNYQFGNVPQGKYNHELWHPEFGVRVVPFNVGRDREVVTLDVDLKRK